MASVQQIEEVYGHAQECIRLFEAIYNAKQPDPLDVDTLKKHVEEGRRSIKGQPRQALRKICKRLLGNNEVACCGCPPATCANGTVFNLGDIVVEAVRLKTPLPGGWREIQAFICKVSNEHDEAVDPVLQLSGQDKTASVAASSGNAKLSPRDLADKHHVDANALRKRLDTWRYDHDAGYVEVANAARNEPKYLYDESAVMLVIESLKAKTARRERAADGQQKKV